MAALQAPEPSTVVSMRAPAADTIRRRAEGSERPLSVTWPSGARVAAVSWGAAW